MSKIRSECIHLIASYMICNSFSDTRMITETRRKTHIQGAITQPCLNTYSIYGISQPKERIMSFPLSLSGFFIWCTHVRIGKRATRGAYECLDTDTCHRRKWINSISIDAKAIDDFSVHFGCESLDLLTIFGSKWLSTLFPFNNNPTMMGSENWRKMRSIFHVKHARDTSACNSSFSALREISIDRSIASVRDPYSKQSRV
jgi:hypothetical protein